jgi:hypothetical protein
MKMAQGKNKCRARFNAGYRALFSRIGFKRIVLIFSLTHVTDW